MPTANLDSLPEECVARVISFTSPRDACRSSLVSATFRSAADSGLAWKKFLPSDCEAIIAAAVAPVEFSSEKELFQKLSSAPLLIDGGKKAFWLDKLTGKKCYVLSARYLSIVWSSDSLCWCWKSLANCRFPEGVELVMACWLEICGKMSTSLLSSNTTYGVYFVFQLANRAFGFDAMPLEFSVEIGDYKSQGTIYISRKDRKNEGLSTVDRRKTRAFVARPDGWLEIKLGEFYRDDNGKELKMKIKEIKGIHLKGGLVVEGMEIRPKH